MGIRKIICILLGGLIIASCSDHKGVSRAKYDELLEQYEQLSANSEGVKQKNSELSREISIILSELNDISGKTSNLQRNVENGRNKENQRSVDQIRDALQIVRKKLNAVKTNAKNNGGLTSQTKKLIENMQQTININEQEIARLNDIVHQKEEEIENLGNKLSTANDNLNHTSSRLKETEDKLQETEIGQWIKVGDELLNTANLLPDVKGHGNMKPIKQAKLKIILRAKACYQRAKELGSTSAQSKISEADYLYNIALD